MANKYYKDRMVVAIASENKDTDEWTVMVEISHRFYPAEKFTSQQDAESFGLKFATEYIDKRPPAK